MDGSPLLVERQGPVLHLVFNSPERLNALGPAHHETVLVALSAAEDDPNVRVVALSGAGRAFCAGEYIKPGHPSWPERLAHRNVDLDGGAGPILLNAATAALRHVSKPTVALMHGYALGAGYDYASSCDIRLATRGCRIGDPRINLALWGAEGWSYRMPRLVGLSQMAPLALCGEVISGERAAEIGFVHQVFDDDVAIRDSAAALLTRMATLDPAAYAAIKADLLADLDARYAQVMRR